MHTGVYMNPPAKRNGRKQKDHLQRNNAMRKFKQDNFGDPYGGGRPDKKKIVQQWRDANPDGTKTDCIRETGLSKPTVLKWWNAA